MANGNESDPPLVGVLGTGYMGGRMARRLLDAGYPLIVYNRTASKAQRLVDAGAKLAPTPHNLTVAELILSSLADDSAVEAAYLGPDGVLAAARPGTVVMEASTVHPATSQRLHAAAAGRGVTLLDTPVSGSTPQAEQGQLVFLVGGDEPTFRRCEPLFKVLGKAWFHLGPPGAGATMKLVINGLMGVGMQALAEAVALGRKGGLAVDAMAEVLGQTAVISPSQRAKLENVRRGEYPPAFPLRLMHKDFGLVARRAAELSVPMPATAAAHQMAAAAKAGGAGEQDFAAVAELMAKMAGL